VTVREALGVPEGDELGLLDEVTLGDVVPVCEPDKVDD
jgi:hypothetical protein